MKSRVRHICSYLTPARVFADIGCDHGYMTKYMLDRGLCERAYISDISAKSLAKAETLLKEHIERGACIPVVADGLRGIPERCDLVLIAGLGGEEIVNILQDIPLPTRFVLQPMKNSEKVRRMLVSRGASIEVDHTFSEGEARKKYYDLICGTNAGGDKYSELEFRYGRDNLNGKMPVPFLFQMEEEREKLIERLSRPALGDKSRAIILEKLNETEEIIHDMQTTLRDRR